MISNQSTAGVSVEDLLIMLRPEAQAKAEIRRLFGDHAVSSRSMEREWPAAELPRPTGV